MTRSFIRRAGITAAVLGFAGTAIAQGPFPPGQQPRTRPGQTQPQPEARPAPTPTQSQPGAQGQGGQMPEQFRQQLDKFASRSEGQIGAADIALERAQHPEVQQLARRIKEERTDIYDNLNQITQARGHTLARPSEERRQASETVQQRIASQQGRDFDVKYVDVMVRDLKQDEQLLKDLRDATPGQDVQMKEFLDRAENTIEEHLAEARQAEQALESGGRAAARRVPERR